MCMLCITMHLPSIIISVKCICLTELERSTVQGNMHFHSFHYNEIQTRGFVFIEVIKQANGRYLEMKRSRSLCSNSRFSPLASIFCSLIYIELLLSLDHTCQRLLHPRRWTAVIRSRMYASGLYKVLYPICQQPEASSHKMVSTVKDHIIHCMQSVDGKL